MSTKRHILPPPTPKFDRRQVTLTEKVFFPECRVIETAGQYLGIYRLFDDDDWKYVRLNGEKILRPKQGAAMADARKAVSRILNPKIRAETKNPKQENPFRDAQVERLKSQAEQQKEAFGGVICKGRIVTVENKGRRHGKRA